MKGGAKVIVEPHRHEGIFIAKQKEDVLVTRNMVVGESVYGEKRISVEQGDQKIEYRVWNPFRYTPFPSNHALSVMWLRPFTVPRYRRRHHRASALRGLHACIVA
jgi:hypothetical protein